MSYKSEIFKDILEQFETEELKNFCIDLLEKRPDENYTIPSSTSLKYHNETQCQSGGQIKHELMACTIMNYLLGLEYMKEKYPKPKQRDSLRIAMLMHDCCKTNGGKYTVHEHPILSGKFVEECEVEHDIKLQLKQYISRLIASHSGEWTTSNRSSVVLPKPETDDQFLIHLCDYLSSRSNLDMIYSDEVNKMINDNLPPEDRPDITTWTFKFGKYAGKSIPEILNIEPDYLRWVKNESDMGKTEPLKTFLEKLG